MIRSLPHVRHIATHTLMLAGFADPKRPHSTLADLQADNSGILYASDDGRFLTTDRIVVDQGHRPTGPRELFVTEQYRSKLSRAVGHRLRVGERLPIGFIWSGLDVTGADPTQVVAPLGVEPLRIAGFGRLADEVLDDSLYPHEELVVSPDVARRYLCAPATVPSTSDEERVIAAVFPPECSISYRYYSLELDDPARSWTCADRAAPPPRAERPAAPAHRRRGRRGVLLPDHDHPPRHRRARAPRGPADRRGARHLRLGRVARDLRRDHPRRRAPHARRP